MRETSYNSFRFSEGDPGSISDVAGLLRYVRDLENRCALAFTALAAMKLERQYAPPARPRDGCLFLADGTDWNPGSGEGIYRYNGPTATYAFIG